MEFIPKNAILEFHPNTLEVIRKTYNLENGRMKQSVDVLEDWVMKQRHFKKKQFICWKKENVKKGSTLSIANRIYAYQNLNTVYDVMEKELLPVDLGGSQKSIRELQDMWINEVRVCSEEHHKYFEVMVDSRTDESLRQVDKFNEQYMGLPGSFRTLTVD